MKRVATMLGLILAGAAAYIAAVEVAFRMLGNRTPDDDEPGGGFGL